MNCNFNRISYSTKRGAPYWFRHDIHYHHFSIPHHHHYRTPNHSKGHIKHKSNRRNKPPFRPMSKLMFMKPSSRIKPLKPIFLSEILRNGEYTPWSKIKSSGPIVKDFTPEENDLETNPFSSVDTIESYPYFKYNRPQTFEIIDNGNASNVAPVISLDDGIIYPAVTKPLFSTTVNQPSINTMWPMTKPSEVFIGEEIPDDIQNIRYVPKTTPSTSYLDKDIVDLLHRIKPNGMYSDLRTPAPQNEAEINDAISKLLLTLISETAIKKIQTYLMKLPTKPQEHNNKMKFIYILENGPKNTSHSHDENPSKQYSVTESVLDQDANDTTYFIVIKSPAVHKNIIRSTTTTILQSLNNTQGKQEIEVKSTTHPSEESLALQKYIMFLAGINKDNYLPRFNTFQKT